MWRTDRTSANFIYDFHFLFNKFVFEFDIIIQHLYENQNKTVWVKKLYVRDRVDMLILDSVYVRRRHVTATQDNCGLLLHRRPDNPVMPRATMMQTPPTDTGITILQLNLSCQQLYIFFQIKGNTLIFLYRFLYSYKATFIWFWLKMITLPWTTTCTQSYIFPFLSGYSNR